MARQSAFQAFLTEFQIRVKKAASESQLARVESQLGIKLPESLRACFLTCNGGQAQDGRSQLELMSLNASLEYQRVPGFFDSFCSYFPFAENNDSNPVCVCCKPPLATYVVLVKHDDAPELKYRSLDGFFRAAVGFIQGEDFLDTHELPSAFDDTERTKKDVAIARKLIDLAAKGDALSNLDRTNALRFACDLLSNNEVDEIGALLKIEDEYVREHAVQRLKQIPGAKAKKILSQLEGAFDAFVEHCAETLQRANIQTSIHAHHARKSMRIEPYGIWLNMEALYSRRQRPDFDDYFVERIRYLIKLKRSKKKLGG